MLNCLPVRCTRGIHYTYRLIFMFACCRLSMKITMLFRIVYNSIFNHSLVVNTTKRVNSRYVCTMILQRYTIFFINTRCRSTVSILIYATCKPIAAIVLWIFHYVRGISIYLTSCTRFFHNDTQHYRWPIERRILVYSTLASMWQTVPRMFYANSHCLSWHWRDGEGFVLRSLRGVVVAHCTT